MNLGVADQVRSDYAGARDHYGQALRLKRDLGDRRGESKVLLGLGTLYTDWHSVTCYEMMLEPMSKSTQSCSTRSGVSSSGLLGRPDRVALRRYRSDECIQLLEHFCYCRRWQRTNESGVPNTPIQALDLVGKDGARDGES